MPVELLVQQPTKFELSLDREGVAALWPLADMPISGRRGSFRGKEQTSRRCFAATAVIIQSALEPFPLGTPKLS